MYVFVHVCAWHVYNYTYKQIDSHTYIYSLGPVTGVLFCSVFTHVYAAFVSAARIHVATTITVVKKKSRAPATLILCTCRPQSLVCFQVKKGEHGHATQKLKAACHNLSITVLVQQGYKVPSANPPGQVQAPARLTKFCRARLRGDCGSRCVGPNINCQWFAGGVCGLVLRGSLSSPPPLRLPIAPQPSSATKLRDQAPRPCAETPGSPCGVSDVSTHNASKCNTQKHCLTHTTFECKSPRVENLVKNNAGNGPEAIYGSIYIYIIANRTL